MSPHARLQTHMDHLRVVLARLAHVRDKRREEELLEEARRAVAAIREARTAVARAERA